MEIIHTRVVIRFLLTASRIPPAQVEGRGSVLGGSWAGPAWEGLWGDAWGTWGGPWRLTFVPKIETDTMENQPQSSAKIGPKSVQKSIPNRLGIGAKTAANRSQTGPKLAQNRSWGGLGGVLGRSLGSWGVPCRLGGIPRGPRVVLGPSWGRLGVVLGRPGAVLGRLGASRGGPRGLRGRILGCIFLLFPVLACKPFGGAFLLEF